MIRHVALWLALCTPAFGHELIVDVVMDQPEVSLRASYGLGEPAGHAAVAASSAAAPDRLGIRGETDAGGVFTFTPPAEGEWLIRVDDGYGHIATRTVVVNWAGPTAELPQPANLWARTGAGLLVIFGLTAFVFWGRRRLANQQP
ncbi:MAG: hypothetical protein O3A53_12940 [Acidobacteria bacterium]|nr:hypothetical protein [Acidobacteriota bacterium]